MFESFYDDVLSVIYKSALKFKNLTTERIRATPLHVETAIVLGRSGDHTQALRVLVHEGRDPHAAQAYCHRAAREQRSQASGPQDEAGLRRTLLLTLLTMYLHSDALAGEALELLGDNALHFPPGKVLELLPGAWSVGLVCRYLVGSLRETLHQRRMGGLQRALAHAEYLRHKVLWVRMKPFSCYQCLTPAATYLVSHTYCF